MTLFTDYFFWPWALGLLLLAPFLIGLYKRRLKLKSQKAVHHSDLSLIAQANKTKKRSSHWSAILFWLAIVFALVGFARPTLRVPEAHPQAGIMLALDVSRSMAAYDILPSRFSAAKDAVKTFVKNLPEGTRVGLVTFAGYATPVVPLTEDHDRVIAAVDYLRMDFGTTIGEGLVSSLKALPRLEERRNLGDSPERFATIILLSDGRNFGGIDPRLALDEVKAQEVTVHTIGVGTLTDAPIPGIPLQYQFAARFDEPLMRAIAEETGGSFNFVDSALALNDVYKDLSQAVIWRFGRDEATAIATLIAALFLFISLILSLSRRTII